MTGKPFDSSVPWKAALNLTSWQPWYHSKLSHIEIYLMMQQDISSDSTSSIDINL